MNPTVLDAARRSRTSAARGLVVALLAGCKGCQPEAELPALLEAEDTTSVAVWVAEGLGTASARVPVFAVNALGAAVPSSDFAVASDATILGDTTPGADGWAEVDLEAAPGRYAVTASADGATGEGAVWLTAARPGEIDAPAAAFPGAPAQLASAGRGYAAAIDGEVWWTGLDGRPPVRVLALPDPVVELSTVEVDEDGVSDLLVTSASRIVILRGRDEGGLAWGVGWRGAGDRPVLGAAVGEFDGDRLSDLAVAVSEDGGASLLVLQGDGAWDFAPVDALAPGYPARDVSLDDLDDDGAGEITFLTDEGLLRRYTKLDEVWASTLTGTQYEVDIGEGGRILPSEDLTGDGVDELIVVGPSIVEPGVAHGWVVTAGADEPARYEVVPVESGLAWAAVATGDLSGDGVADLAYVAPNRIARVLWNEALVNFEVQFWSDAPVGAAVAVSDVDADGVVDMLAGDDDGLRVFRGARDADNPETPDTDETAPWRPAAADTLVFGLDLLLDPVVADRSGDGIADVVAVVTASDTGGVALEGAVGVAATDTTRETLQSAGAVTVTASGTALDLAVCGADAYVLYQDADTSGEARTFVARARLASGLGPSLLDAVAVEGARLACGAFAVGVLAVIDEVGGVSYIDADGVVTAGESGPPWAHAVAWDPDGDGVDELYGCEEAGCRVAVGDLDGDGAPERVALGSEGVSVWFGDAETRLDARGAPVVADTDGDGVPELVLGAGGRVTVHHGVAGALSPATTSWTWRPARDAVQLGDLDGDGLPDVFLVGEDRYPDDPAGDSWTGTLIYARAE